MKNTPQLSCFQLRVLACVCGEPGGKWSHGVMYLDEAIGTTGHSGTRHAIDTLVKKGCMTAHRTSRRNCPRELTITDFGRTVLRDTIETLIKESGLTFP